ncbi:MAG: crotonase/enoyl-CoA hydratase family protein [Myxococcales bacterium]|nr:crotonase/enoyl-CoA hydratase family protein [Myxococcales bacterium]MDH3484976.1 crotonase/enoyl-CoA hydratase family protein [Myxococcales bacterium]
MSDRDIEYEKRSSIGLIGFDRPEKRNAFTVEMFERLAEVCTEADDDDDVRAIVVYGKGTDTTTGLDLMNVGPSFRAGKVPIPAELVDPWHVVGRLRKTPMVTAVHGRCFTLGTEIALCSDICVAAEGTVFGLKEVRVGIMPAGGGTFRFVQTAGYSNAMRYVLTGDEFDAAEGFRLGVVQEVVAPGAHLTRAVELAERIAAQAPLAVRAALANAQVSLLEGWKKAIADIVPVQVPLINSEDAVEAAMAMMQKRPPSFKGK